MNLKIYIVNKPNDTIALETDSNWKPVFDVDKVMSWFENSENVVEKGFVEDTESKYHNQRYAIIDIDESKISNPLHRLNILDYVITDLIKD